MDQTDYVAAASEDAELVRAHLREWCDHANSVGVTFDPSDFFDEKLVVPDGVELTPLTHEHLAAIERLATTLVRGGYRDWSQKLMRLTSVASRGGFLAGSPANRAGGEWSPREEDELALRKAEALAHDRKNVIGTYLSTDVPDLSNHTEEAILSRVSFIRDRVAAYCDSVCKHRGSDPKPYQLTDDPQVQKVGRALATFAQSRSMDDVAEMMLRIVRGDCLDDEQDENVWPYSVVSSWVMLALDRVELAAMEGEQPPGPVQAAEANNWSKRLSIDKEQSIVILDGSPLSVTPDSAEIFAAMLAAFPKPITAVLHASKPSRLFARWPNELQLIVERNNKGYSLRDPDERPDSRPDAPS